MLSPIKFLFSTRNTPLRITGPLIVVSPHFDDISLSCEALIARPEAMTVLHVFTTGPVPAATTEWDRLSGFAHSDEAMTARCGEAMAAMAGTPHVFRDAGLLDNQYVMARLASDSATLTDAVLDWLEQVETPCTVAMPVGAGLAPRSRLMVFKRLHNIVLNDRLSPLFSRTGQPRHVDHLFSRNVTLDAVRGRQDVNVILYEEFPYLLSKRGDDAAFEVARSLGSRIRIVRSDVSVDVRRKARRLQAYRSQLPLLFPRQAVANDTSLAAFLPETERYWRIERR